MSPLPFVTLQHCQLPSLSSLGVRFRWGVFLFHPCYEVLTRADQSNVKTPMGHRAIFAPPCGATIPPVF